MTFYWLFLFLPVSYLIGAISFSLILSQFVLRSDIRKSGSGNAGATNMLRSFGLKWAVIILILDMLKGIIPALVGALVFGWGTTDGTIALYACGISAVLGHCFPIYSKFKGGKGVATSIGVFLVANPWFTLFAFFAILIYGTIFEYASMASILFITSIVLWEGFVGNNSLTVCILLAFFYTLVLFMHRQNIVRLLCGRERRAYILGKIYKNKMKKNQQKWHNELSS